MSQRQPSHRSLDPVPETHELESYSSHSPEQSANQTETTHHRFNTTASAEEREGENSIPETTPGKELNFSVVRWWKDNIARALPVDDDVRDHFALERTFLAYIRTSNALASTAIAMFQLSRLSMGSSSESRVIDPRILKLEKAVTVIMIAGALLLTVAGASRFFVRQKKVEHGLMKIGGLDLWGIGGGFTVIEILLFISILLH